jgi:hypothetical protein
VYYIITKLFVFKLEGDLRKENSVYLCIRYILCCYQASTLAFEALLRRLTKLLARFLF